MGQYIKRYCSCDDIGDDPCPCHRRENELQDERAELRLALIEISNIIAPWLETEMHEAGRAKHIALKRCREVVFRALKWEGNNDS